MTGNYLPVPTAQPTDTPFVRVCFNFEYLPMILNALDDMNNWYVFDTGENQAVDEQTKIDRLIEVFMLACDYTPKGRKVNVGDILSTVNEDIPDGFLLCDGSSYVGSTYPELFAVIPDVFKLTVSGEPGFVVPDLIARSIVGVGEPSGTGRTFKNMCDTGGKETHTLIEAELPALSPRVTAVQDTANTALPGQTRRFAQPSSTLIYSTVHNTPTTLDSRVSFGGGGSHENKSPYMALNYIICASSEECC